MRNDVPVIPANDFQALKMGQSMIRNQPLAGHAGRRRQAPQAVLLALVAVGMLWGNVLLFHLSDFPVTLDILLTAGLFIIGIGNWIGRGYRPSRLLLPALALLLYEFVIHGVFGGGISDFQWPRSFALLAMCTGLLIASSRFRISEYQLPTLVMWVFLTGVLVGLAPRGVNAAGRNLAALQVLRVAQGQAGLGTVDKAIAWGNSALQRTPTDRATRRLLGYVYIYNQQAQSALDVLQATTADCTDAITCYQRGQALYELGRYEEAIAIWRSVPNTDLYFAFQGDLAYEQGNKSDAFRLYDISWRVSDTPA